ncbi:MAG: hypothetical protein M3270_00120 [Thermoproteota archaeon]|nr:hypothetical protein [Thermoproteota archaeon]
MNVESPISDTLEKTPILCIVFQKLKFESPQNDERVGCTLRDIERASCATGA